MILWLCYNRRNSKNDASWRHPCGSKYPCGTPSWKVITFLWKHRKHHFFVVKFLSSNAATLWNYTFCLTKNFENFDLNFKNWFMWGGVRRKISEYFGLIVDFYRNLWCCYYDMLCVYVLQFFGTLYSCKGWQQSGRKILSKDETYRVWVLPSIMKLKTAVFKEIIATDGGFFWWLYFESSVDMQPVGEDWGS